MPPPTRRDWVAALTLTLALGWTFTCTGAAALTLEDELGTGLAVVGLFTTVFLLAEGLVSIPAGGLCDRVGARRVALASTVVMAGGSALALAASAVWPILLGRAITGVGTGLAFVAAVAWLRGGGALAQGLVGGFGLAGAGLAVALVPHLEGPLDWRAPFVPEIGLALVAAALVAVAPGGGPAGARRRAPLRDLAAQPVLWRYGAVGAFSFGASFAVGAWIVALLTQSDDLSARTGALAGSLVLFGGILTRPLGGALVRRRPPAARLIMVGSVLVGVGAIALLALDVSAGVTALAALLVGLAAGLPYGIAMDGAIRAFPDRPAEAAAVVIAMYVVAGVAIVLLLGIAFGAGAGRLGFALLAAAFLPVALIVPRPAGAPAAAR